MKHLALLLLTVLATGAHAKLMFEGYYRIEKGTTHIGYLIHRDDLNEQAKERTISYFALRQENGTTSYNGARVTSKTTAAMAFEPVKYMHMTSGAMKGPPLMEEGVFKGASLAINVSDVSEAIRNDKTKKVSRPQKLVAKFNIDVKPGNFLSTFIPLMVAAEGEANLKVGNSYSFTAFAEEARYFAPGDFKITRAFNTADGKRVFAALCRYPADLTEYFLYPDGQVFAYRTFGDVSIFLTTNRESGIGELPFPKEAIQKVFGDLPFGLENPVSKALGKVDSQQMMRAMQPLSDADKKFAGGGKATKKLGLKAVSK